MIRVTMAVIAALTLVGSTLAVPSQSGAGNGGGKIDVRAKLEPCCNAPEPEAEGKAKRRAVTKNGSILIDQFRASVEIPIPSLGLGITDPTTADIRLTLSRAGLDYAVCFLVLDENQGTSAEFQVRVISIPKKGTAIVRQIKGQCDIDLAQGNVQPGVPDVQDGDVATLSAVNSATSTSIDFLQGAFSAH